MPKFEFEKIKALGNGQFKILQLEIDGVKQVDKFGLELKGTQYEDEYQTLLGWMEYYTKTGDIGNGRLKEIKRGKSNKIKEYEFRSTNLRLYAVQGDTGKIIILCGYKKEQTSDLKYITLLKREIFPD